MINNLIFKELIKRGFTEEQGTRVFDLSDSKLWYLSDDQAKGFLRIEKDPNYKKEIVETEMSLIKKTIPKIGLLIRGRQFNLVDLGCGDGKKAAEIIENLPDNFNIRYCPIDISAYMVSQAVKEVREVKKAEINHFQYNISDFENLSNITPLLRVKPFNNNLLLLLGNTLGNFPIKDLLYSIKKSMKKRDVLIIGNGIAEKEADWKKAYENQLINEWLVQVLLQLGLKPTDVYYHVRVKGNVIQEMYQIQKDITLSHLGQEVELKNKDEIVVANSFKYNLEELEHELKVFFSHVKLVTNPQKTYALAICSS